MKILYMLVMILSLSTLDAFEYDFTNSTEFGETTGTVNGYKFYPIRDDYLIYGTPKGISIFHSEADGGITLIDTVNTRIFQYLASNDTYLALSNWLRPNIDVYNISDMNNIHYSHTITTNYNVAEIKILSNNRLLVNKLNDHSLMIDITNGNQLMSYPQYFFYSKYGFEEDSMLAVDTSSWSLKWVALNEQNQIQELKTENRAIDYGTSSSCYIFLAIDNYIKMYNDIYEEVALDSILVNWYDVTLASRGIEIFDSNLLYIDSEFNNISQMDESVLKIYKIVDNSLQCITQKFYLDNWDNRGLILYQKVISCNEKIYVNAEVEGIKGYQLDDNQLELISQYGDIAYWENSFLTRDNKVYLNARKKDRECIIYDLSNYDYPTVVENDFAFGEYHSFPYQTDYLYKISYLDNEVEFYHLNQDDTTSLIGSIPEDYYHLYENFIPLKMENNYLVYQFYNNIFVGSFLDGNFVESYNFNLGSNSNMREYTAFMKDNHLYSLRMANSLIDIYQVNAESYSFLLTDNSFNFSVSLGSSIVSFSDEYICFNGSSYYYYLMSIDSLTSEISGIYRLDYENIVLNNIGNYLFVGKRGIGTNDRLLEIKEFSPENETHFSTIATISFPARLTSVDILQIDDNNYNLVVTTMGSIFYYQCAITPNGNLDISPVSLNAFNYPNPFNPETTISYDISENSHVTVDIYNIKGQKVKSLLNESQEAGQHSIIWTGDNEDGKRVASGTYFYKVKSGDKEIVNKMMLMK